MCRRWTRILCCADRRRRPSPVFQTPPAGRPIPDWPDSVALPTQPLTFGGSPSRWTHCRRAASFIALRRSQIHRPRCLLYIKTLELKKSGISPVMRWGRVKWRKERESGAAIVDSTRLFNPKRVFVLFDMFCLFSTAGSARKGEFSPGTLVRSNHY